MHGGLAMEAKKDNLVAKILNKVISAWDNYWFCEISPYPISAFRILFGIYLFIYFIRFLPNVEIMFSNLGIYSPFGIPDIASPLPIAWIIYLLTIGVILMFTVGFWTRFTAPLLLLLFLYYFFLNFAVKNCSYDRIIIIFLFMLSLGKINSVWSLKFAQNKFQVNFQDRFQDRSKDQFQNKNTLIIDSDDKEPKVSAWLTRILCLQVILLYFGAGLYKLFQPAWSNGEILKMTLVSNWGTPLAFWIANLNLPNWLYDSITITTVWAETLFGFLLCIRPIQKYIFFFGFLFHLFVWILLSIPEFMLCVITYVLFVEPKVLENIGIHIRGRAIVFWEKIKALKSPEIGLKDDLS